MVGYFVSESYIRDKLGLPKGQRLGLWQGGAGGSGGGGGDAGDAGWNQEEDGLGQDSEGDDSWGGGGESDEELHSLAAMGLPTSFGGAASQRGTGRPRRRRQHTPAAPAEAAAGQWQQAWDEHHGACYYYNESLQATQWEPPAEGYVPMPPEWAAFAEEQLAALSLGVGGVEAEAAAMAEAGVGTGAGAEGGGGGGRAGEDGEDGATAPPAPSPPCVDDEGVDGDGHSGGCKAQRAAGKHTRFDDEDVGSSEGGDGGEGGAERAGGRRKRLQSLAAGEQVLMEAAQCPHPKYWYQRYRLFTRFNQGCKMDEEGWYSITPEAMARHHARRLARPGGVALDAFCGVGGNAIQLAFTCGHVIAVDMDPERIELAKHNAQVYGVAHRISFIRGDFLQLAAGGGLSADVVFLSPPWGGMAYEAAEGGFDVRTMMGGLDGVDILDKARAISPDVAYYLPRNTGLEQLGALSGPGGPVEVERNYLNKKLKAITAYFGGTAGPPPFFDEGGEEGGEGAVPFFTANEEEDTVRPGRQ